MQLRGSVLLWSCLFLLSGVCARKSGHGRASNETGPPPSGGNIWRATFHVRYLGRNGSIPVEEDPRESERMHGSDRGEKLLKLQKAVQYGRVWKRGSFVVEVHDNWAPLGAARFRELLAARFYDHSRFFRVIEGYVAQFGIAADPLVNDNWEEEKIPDDKRPNGLHNKRGFMSFAMRGKKTRTTQIFVNLMDNSRRLDDMKFVPFAQVVEGMDVVDQFYSMYGGDKTESYRMKGPEQDKVHSDGNKYLKKEFPNLSFIDSVKVDGDSALDAIAASVEVDAESAVVD